MDVIRHRPDLGRRGVDDSWPPVAVAKGREHRLPPIKPKAADSQFLIGASQRKSHTYPSGHRH
jgi:hypothetical protein